MVNLMQMNHRNTKTLGNVVLQRATRESVPMDAVSRVKFRVKSELEGPRVTGRAGRSGPATVIDVPDQQKGQRQRRQRGRGREESS